MIVVRGDDEGSVILGRTPATDAAEVDALHLHALGLAVCRHLTIERKRHLERLAERLQASGAKLLYDKRTCLGVTRRAGCAARHVRGRQRRHVRHQFLSGKRRCRDRRWCLSQQPSRKGR